MSPISENIAVRNKRASDWIHRGIALLEENMPAKLEEAVRCFDKAIALRQTLPLEESHWFRYGLSAGWLNRGDALARLEEKENWAEAMKSYNEALKLLLSLPLAENSLYPRRLAIAWINRGFVLQKQGAADSIAEASRCFSQAAQILESPVAAQISDKALLLAGARINLAGAWLRLPEPVAADARVAVKSALSLLKESERIDRAGAESGLKARYILCQAVAYGLGEKLDVSPDWIADATDAVDEGIALVRFWELRGEKKFHPWARDLFRFGCRIYQEYQPHFLSEFILESLDPEKTENAIPLNQDTHDAAMIALWSVLKELQLGGFQAIATPQFEEMLAHLRELRMTEERLGELRHSFRR